jgi:hypothetical protein
LQCLVKASKWTENLFCERSTQPRSHTIKNLIVTLKRWALPRKALSTVVVRKTAIDCCLTDPHARRSECFKSDDFRQNTSFGEDRSRLFLAPAMNAEAGLFNELLSDFLKIAISERFSRYSYRARV